MVFPHVALSFSLSCHQREVYPPRFTRENQWKHSRERMARHAPTTVMAGGAFSAYRLGLMVVKLAALALAGAGVVRLVAAAQPNVAVCEDVDE